MSYIVVMLYIYTKEELSQNIEDCKTHISIIIILSHTGVETNTADFMSKN